MPIGAPRQFLGVSQIGSAPFCSIYSFSVHDFYMDDKLSVMKCKDGIENETRITVKPREKKKP